MLIISLVQGNYIYFIIMNNSTKRVLTALVAVPTIYIIVYLGGIIYLLFILALTLVGQMEYRHILKEREIPFGFSGSVLSALIVLSAYLGYVPMNLAFILSVIIIMIFCLRFHERFDALRKMGATIFGLIYIGLFLAHAVLLRNISDFTGIYDYAYNSQNLSDPGFFFVVFAIACVFIHDTCALYTGQMFGKHKLAPNISPGKTIEGTIGGFIGCVITAIVVNFLFGHPLSSDWTIGLSVLITLAATFGDLAESAIKRGAGLKDSGDIVPGHGGVLDRFDSLIFVFPVTYYAALVYYYSKGVWL